ncbi:MAG: HD-GYP domain-containing protein [Eubacterium sp.]|nr:HD-GYP domain-containing protein [Eubacterium sp.]
MTGMWIVIGGLIVVAVGIVIVLAGMCRKVDVLRKKQKQYHDIVNQSLETFAHAIDAKDQNTNGHSQRVAIYSAEIAKRMGMSDEEQEQIYYMGMLHDIGKIGIPDAILKKPGKLTEEEMQIIRNHPTIGGEILKDFTAIQGISDGARYHHERYDGNGYNEGLKGEEIPLAARIICVADSYDTMSSKRVYKELHEENYILSELDQCSGKQFDPQIVPFMIEMIKDGTAPLPRPDYKSR